MTNPQTDLRAIARTLATPVWDGDKDNGTALRSAIRTVREGYSSFWEPLNKVADKILVGLCGPKAWTEAAIAAVGDWEDDARDAFLMIAGYSAHWRCKYSADYQPKTAVVHAAMTKLATALGGAKDKTVQSRLTAWGFVKRATPIKLPTELPTRVEDALALYTALDLTRDQLPLGKPAKDPSPALPAPLRAFYAKHASLGSRTIATEKKLAAEGKSLAYFRKLSMEEMEDEVDRGAIHPFNLSPASELVAFGSTSSGDLYFFDAKLDLGTQEPPVLIFSHDEGYAAIAASSLGAFIAAQVLEAAVAGGALEGKLARLIAKDKKLIKVPPALAKVPKSARRRDEDDDDD
jgi:hypothetical protein